MSEQQFLIDSWSYSKVTTFARNEKAFEMSYIFNCRPRLSATTIAGNAYHSALEFFFFNKKAGNDISIAQLEGVAFEYIDNVAANVWKLQKTTPTIDECRTKANNTSVSLIKNFFSELKTYVDDISEVLDVEIYCDEYLTVNGVEIPLPCHCKIDLVIKTKDGRNIIIDHKSKAAYTSDDEIGLSIGVQAITYIKCYESKTGTNINEVWFIENKYSQNKDKSPQLRAFKLSITEDTRRLYEALLYEPLKRMATAVNDPDYTYMINDSDNYVDRAELYDFWARTMISEVEDFNIADNKKDLISKRLKKIRDSSIAAINPKIIREFKNNAATFIQYDLTTTNMTQEEKIEHVLRVFGAISRVSHVFDGYSSKTYLLEVSAGVKVSSIYSHKLDIANALDVPTVRLSQNLVVHEGKSYLGIELVKKRDRNLFYDSKELKGQKIPIGKDNFDNTIYWDLDNPSTPHVLICGATGSGKSVSVRSTIEYAKEAGISDIIILDPKYEFNQYKSSSVKVINDILDIENTMSELVDQMNTKVEFGNTQKTLVIFDEFADAVANSRKGVELNQYEYVQVGAYATGAPKMKRECTSKLKSLEENLRVLLQKGRSAGYRVVAATQRASVKVITGDAKVNFPVQICFRVPKEADSRVVLDEAGAESLAGMGDGLMRSPEYPDIVRFQAFFKE